MTLYKWKTDYKGIKVKQVPNEASANTDGRFLCIIGVIIFIINYFEILTSKDGLLCQDTESNQLRLHMKHLV